MLSCMEGEDPEKTGDKSECENDDDFLEDEQENDQDGQGNAGIAEGIDNDESTNDGGNEEGAHNENVIDAEPSKTDRCSHDEADNVETENDVPDERSECCNEIVSSNDDGDESNSDMVNGEKWSE